MVKIGCIQTLKINNITSIGCYLDAETGLRKDNILLPKSQLPEDIQENDEIEVFIYRDSDDRLIATRKKPYILLNQLAYLKVVDITKVGAFLDWGLEKELFLPFREQKYEIIKGNNYLVGLYLDNTERLCATTDISDYLETETFYKKNDWVQGTVYKIVDNIGCLVAVDNKYFGLIPENENFKKLNPGDVVKVRVIRRREDGKLDLSTRELSHIQMNNDANYVLTLLEKNNGFLDLNDRSSADLIKNKLQMSKKSFKKAVGRLLKLQKIVQNEKGILLK